jgi:acyl carrier protein
LAARVFASVERFFSLPPGTVSAGTSADDIAGWDSVNHVGLILAIEEEFGLSFDVAVVGDFRNVGELAAECARLAHPAAIA